MFPTDAPALLPDALALVPGDALALLPGAAASGLASPAPGTRAAAATAVADDPAAASGARATATATTSATAATAAAAVVVVGGGGGGRHGPLDDVRQLIVGEVVAEEVGVQSLVRRTGARPECRTLQQLEAQIAAQIAAFKASAHPASRVVVWRW